MTYQEAFVNRSTTGRKRRYGTRAARAAIRTLALAGVLAIAATGVTAADAATADSPTVWLCRPGLPGNPCAIPLAATAVTATGAKTVVNPSPPADPPFDCFYVYPTVSTEPTMNADLQIQQAETGVAMFQASRFSQVCNVWAPMYKQNTHAAFDAYPDLNLPAASANIAYNSLKAGFEDYLEHYNHGRPIIFLGHSQGAAILIKLLASTVDHNPRLRDQVTLAALLGGDVEVKPGSTTGGSFQHLPVCTRSGQPGCVIAYSTFPSTPPASALFGRPGQGVALQSGQTAKNGVQVACVNPAAVRGGTADLDPFFLATAQDAVTTPWLEYPGLYSARCERDRTGAAWLQVTKSTGPADARPVVTVQPNADYGYHLNDPNLALGDLVADVAAAETSWTAMHR
jgi:hypothetical protein